jgi:Helix-turn-helix domain
MTKRIAPTALEQLLADPEKLKAAIETERRAKLPPQGWSGLSVLARADWQLSLQLGDNVRQCDVAPRSPAYRAGIRTGNFIRPIRINGAEGLPVDDLDAVALPAGQKIVVEFCRHDRGRASGWLPVEITLARPPRVPTIPAWKKLAPTPSGQRVRRVERTKFLKRMGEHPEVTAIMLKALNLAALKYDNDRNIGLWPSYSTWARDLGRSRRTVIEIVARLRHLGILKVVSGPSRQRSSNVYQITWPGRGPAKTVTWI